MRGWLLQSLLSVLHFWCVTRLAAQSKVYKCQDFVTWMFHICRLCSLSLSIHLPANSGVSQHPATVNSDAVDVEVMTSSAHRLFPWTWVWWWDCCLLRGCGSGVLGPPMQLSVWLSSFTSLQQYKNFIFSIPLIFFYPFDRSQGTIFAISGDLILNGWCLKKDTMACLVLSSDPRPCVCQFTKVVLTSLMIMEKLKTA